MTSGSPPVMPRCSPCSSWRPFSAERVEREAESRSRPATVALTLAGAAVLVFTVALAASSMSDSDRNAAGEVAEKRPLGVFELQPGDCLSGISEATEIRAVEAVPCGQRHQAQVLSSSQLPDGAFPGLRAIYREGDRRCNTALRVYVSPRRNPPGPFYLHPTEESWALGDREITCVALFEKLRRGSLRPR